MPPCPPLLPGRHLEHSVVHSLQFVWCCNTPVQILSNEVWHMIRRLRDAATECQCGGSKRDKCIEAVLEGCGRVDSRNSVKPGESDVMQQSTLEY